MDTRVLRYVAVVAEEGNLTRAAGRLFVSQPALSKQIKQLEKQLGFQLFTRSRAGMTLTEPGRAFAERLPTLLADWDHLLADTNSAASRAAHVLRGGFVASAANEATSREVALHGPVSAVCTRAMARDRCPRRRVSLCRRRPGSSGRSPGPPGRRRPRAPMRWRPGWD